MNAAIQRYFEGVSVPTVIILNNRVYKNGNSVIASCILYNYLCRVFILQIDFNPIFRICDRLLTNLDLPFFHPSQTHRRLSTAFVTTGRYNQDE